MRGRGEGMARQCGVESGLVPYRGWVISRVPGRARARGRRRRSRRASPVLGDADAPMSARMEAMAGDGWSSLFASAFRQSRNAMVLVDGERRVVEPNAAFVELLGRRRGTLVGRHLYTFLAGGPLATPGEWREAIAQGRFTGNAALLHADGSEIGVQWAAVTEMATGRRLVLFVALNTSRWG